jgi:hypothetical protein
MWNLFFWISCCLFVYGFFKKTIRISHLVLWLGALMLLTRGVRFIVEYCLLTLPGLRNLIAYAYPDAKDAFPKLAKVAAGCYLVLLPILMIRELPHGEAYPFSNTNMPYGTARFLQRIGSGGNVLNSPNYGGYLRWELYPKYRILMSMESVFTGSDIHLAHSVFSDRQSLGKLLSSYNIDFIAAPIMKSKFKDLIKDFPDFVMVFFDDAEVLYVNKRNHAAIAQDYGITGIDPFELITKGYGEISDINDKSSWLVQLPKMLDIAPDCNMINYLLAMAYQQEDRNDMVLPLAERLISNMPAQAIGYLLTADALANMGRMREALGYYKKALSRSNINNWAIIQRKMGRAYFSIGAYRKAYVSLKNGFDILSYDTNPEDIYTLAVLAQSLGRKKHAKALAVYLYEFRVSEADPIWAERKAELKKTGIDI